MLPQFFDDRVRLMDRKDSTADEMIYKICSRAEWEAAVAVGEFRGSAADHRDGFIHFSAGHQVSETARKHFSVQNDLLLIGVRANAPGDALKWEPSRGGDLFPHLYGPLPTSAATEVRPLERDSAGQVLLQDQRER